MPVWMESGSAAINASSEVHERPAPERAARVLLALCGAWLVVYELHVVLVPTWRPFVFGRAGHDVVLALASAVCIWRGLWDRRERAAWLLIGLGCASWTAGEIYFTFVLWNLHQVPAPSWADLGYLGFPPLVFIGIMLLTRRRVRGIARTAWVDALAAAFAIAGLSAAVVFDPLLHSVGGTAPQVATNLAYPIGDLLVLGMLVGAIGLSGWRLTPTWLLLGAGIVLFWTADSLYLVQSADGTYVSGGVYDAGWWGGIALLAAAAWVPESEPSLGRGRQGTQTILLPLAFAALALGVLVYGAVRSSPMNGLAVVLSGASLAAIGVRLYVTFRQNQRMLHASQAHALTDSLTGLPNRRALMEDLEARMEHRRGRSPWLLAIFDLDGFKSYNDLFGHLAGDALLRRLGARLATAVLDRGRAYRLGGDEFCVLVDSGPEVDQAILDAAVSALTESGDGFSVGCSCGVATLPLEAGTATAALGLADQRMYSEKQHGRTSPGSQSADVLVRALAERAPDIESHLSGVAELAALTAARLGLEPTEVELIRRAGALHDIGKLAIPDAILNKPTPLDLEEWAFIRRHPVIGERILAAAPALAPVARLVRASHERFDGNGYPDRLAGTAIPLGARIICVCDAYDAMTVQRPYNRPRSARDAEAELRGCAGSHFDPVVVDAFCRARRELETSGLITVAALPASAPHV